MLWGVFARTNCRWSNVLSPNRVGIVLCFQRRTFHKPCTWVGKLYFSVGTDWCLRWGSLFLLQVHSVVYCKRACPRVWDLWVMRTGRFSLRTIPVILQFNRSEMNGKENDCATRNQKVMCCIMLELWISLVLWPTFSWPLRIFENHHSRARGFYNKFLNFAIHFTLDFERFIFKPEHFQNLYC